MCVSFAMSIIWIYIVAGELVALLQVRGLGIEEDDSLLAVIRLCFGVKRTFSIFHSPNTDHRPHSVHTS